MTTTTTLTPVITWIANAGTSLPPGLVAGASALIGVAVVAISVRWIFGWFRSR